MGASSHAYFRVALLLWCLHAISATCSAYQTTRNPPLAALRATNASAGVQADVSRLVEAGGGTALDAQAQAEVAQAALVAAQLAVRLQGGRAVRL